MVRAGNKTMISGSAEVCLSALFVDFDNVYLSLRRQSEEAARPLCPESAGLDE